MSYLNQGCDLCVNMRRAWVLLGLHVSEMSEMISFNMGVKFGISLNVGERFLQGPFMIMCWKAVVLLVVFHVTYKIQ